MSAPTLSHLYAADARDRHLYFGVVILARSLHAARGIARGHARFANALLVEPGA